MHPGARQAASKRMKDWWAKMSPEERAARKALRLAQFRRRQPERAAAYDLAMASPSPCHVCGGEGHPFFAKLPSNTILGWRCHEHWPNKKPAPGEPGAGVVQEYELLD